MEKIGTNAENAIELLDYSDDEQLHDAWLPSEAVGLSLPRPLTKEEDEDEEMEDSARTAAPESAPSAAAISQRVSDHESEKTASDKDDSSLEFARKERNLKLINRSCKGYNTGSGDDTSTSKEKILSDDAEEESSGKRDNIDRMQADDREDKSEEGLRTSHVEGQTSTPDVGVGFRFKRFFSKWGWYNVSVSEVRNSEKVGEKNRYVITYYDSFEEVLSHEEMMRAIAQSNLPVGAVGFVFCKKFELSGVFDGTVVEILSDGMRRCYYDEDGDVELNTVEELKELYRRTHPHRQKRTKSSPLAERKVSAQAETEWPRQEKLIEKLTTKCQASRHTGSSKAFECAHSIQKQNHPANSTSSVTTQVTFNVDGEGSTNVVASAMPVFSRTENVTKNRKSNKSKASPRSLIDQTPSGNWVRCCCRLKLCLIFHDNLTRCLICKASKSIFQRPGVTDRNFSNENKS